MFVCIFLFVFICNSVQGPFFCTRNNNVFCCIENILLPNGAPLMAPILDAEINQICGNLLAAQSCYDQEEVFYSRYAKTYYELSKNLAEFYCGEGRNGLTTMQTCFNNDSLYIQSANYCKSIAINVGQSFYNATCETSDHYKICFINASINCDSVDFITKIFELYAPVNKFVYGCDSNYTECIDYNWNICFTKYLSSNIDIRELEQGKFNYNQIFSLPTSIFNESCSLADNYYDCLITEYQCSNSESMIKYYLGLMYATQYLCYQDREGYDELVACNLYNFQMFTSCNSIYPYTCRSTQLLFNCAVNQVLTFCGNISTIENYLYRSLLPFANDFYNCTLSISQSNKYTSTTTKIGTTQTTKIDTTQTISQSSKYTNTTTKIDTTQNAVKKIYKIVSKDGSKPCYTTNFNISNINIKTLKQNYF